MFMCFMWSISMCCCALNVLHNQKLYYLFIYIYINRILYDKHIANFDSPRSGRTPFLFGESEALSLLFRERLSGLKQGILPNVWKFLWSKFQCTEFFGGQKLVVDIGR